VSGYTAIERARRALTDAQPFLAFHPYLHFETKGLVRNSIRLCLVKTKRRNAMNFYFESIAVQLETFTPISLHREIPVEDQQSASSCLMDTGLWNANELAGPISGQAPLEIVKVVRRTCMRFSNGGASRSTRHAVPCGSPPVRTVSIAILVGRTVKLRLKMDRDRSFPIVPVQSVALNWGQTSL